MDSNKNHHLTSNSTGTDHFFPTSATSPHFFDPVGLPTFLDSPNFPASWPPPEQTNYAATNTAAANTPAISGPTPAPTTRPSKKRSRASRRAPTTVLTTDTSNFRAMVQEFTGIPAPPFASPTSAATSLHYFPRSLISPPPSFLFHPGDKFQHPSGPDPVNFQSLLQQPQGLGLPQPAAPGVVLSSGSELGLPGVIGAETRSRQQQQQQVDPTRSTVASAHVLRAEKGSSEGRGEGLLEPWVCSSD